jgi:hypothetical protein
VVLRVELLAQEGVLGNGFVVRERAFDGQLKLVELERLLEIVERAALHRIHGRFYGTHRSDHNDSGRRAHTSRLGQQRKTGWLRFLEIQIRDEHLDFLPLQNGVCRFEIAAREHLMTVRAQKL